VHEQLTYVLAGVESPDRVGEQSGDGVYLDM
jgi:hypothetical protein